LIDLRQADIYSNTNTMGANEMGLYSNIAAKKARIKAGSGEKMRKVGDKGAPAKGAFKAIKKSEDKKKGK
jgi:hypothetical protein